LEFRNQPTISWLYLIVVNLLAIVEEEDKSVEGIEQLCQILKKEILTRFKDVIEDDMFVVATFIDPATSHLLNDEACDKAKTSLAEMVRSVTYYSNIS